MVYSAQQSLQTTLSSGLNTVFFILDWLPPKLKEGGLSNIYTTNMSLSAYSHSLPKYRETSFIPIRLKTVKYCDLKLSQILTRKSPLWKSLRHYKLNYINSNAYTWECTEKGEIIRPKRCLASTRTLSCYQHVLVPFFNSAQMSHDFSLGEERSNLRFLFLPTFLPRDTIHIIY